MYRTDKQFMKNPATAPSRIFIGGIPKAVIADDLDNKFSKYGKILGLVINSGFAFIQYDTEQEAHAAIQAENGTMLMGRKINVQQALAPKSNNRDPAQTPNQADAFHNKPGQIPQSPMSTQPDPVALDKINFEPPNHSMEHSKDKDDAPVNVSPQKFEDDRSRKKPMRGGRKSGAGQPRSRERFEAPPPRDMMFPEREGYYGGRNEYVDNYNPGLHPPPKPEIAAPSSDRNDCEIIVVSRALVEYAEFIESKLKALGLVVDLMFPNENVPIGRVLASISSRGCLYAILVMPQNEEHRSLTLNILHSIPQEHRNMPLDDALVLISRNFEAYMRGEKPQPEDPNKMNLSDQHPKPVQMLLNLLAENRMLTSSQYDRVIKYLQERRDLQLEFEVIEGVSHDSNDSSSKQNELQNRILNILNKGSDSMIPTSITAPDPVAKEAPTPLLKDPSVQKALDSLLSGDMLKTIAENM
ncbi:nuclear receptor coactivator protein neosin [Rhynchophorus ferrugineus]|uniref:RRM domain-containing protein n=1 Tax=Rhynchophorus ferrugineus TaxID=354439 RepID=A0A834HXE3_RHYFE|nr:hypothetical protein GWI33_016428 [Rhynchophorus ferrugineus]